MTRGLLHSQYGQYGRIFEALRRFGYWSVASIEIWNSAYISKRSPFFRNTKYLRLSKICPQARLEAALNH